jgi:hypothetical protein
LALRTFYFAEKLQISYNKNLSIMEVQHDSANIFNDMCRVSPNKLYYSLNGNIAHNHKFYKTKLDIEVIADLEVKYGNNIGFDISKHIDMDSKPQPELEKIVAILKKDLILYYDTIYLNILHNGSESDLNGILEAIQPHIQKKEEKDPDRFYMIVHNGNDFHLSPFKIRQTDIDVKKYYNDDFEHVHQEILSFVNMDNQCGLVILHGKQGTGKTSYIRHLIHSTKKNVIYMNGELASQISQPSFIAFMAKQNDSIVVMEDCEELLMARASGRSVNAGLINILNMSDGLLGDALSLKFICTFNAPLRDIDKALLRKGRLVARYEFMELAPTKANVLIEEKKLPIPEISKPLTLAELFNYKKCDFDPRRCVVGF